MTLAIHAGIRFLAENPMASRETNLAEIRVKILRRYNVKIFYRMATQSNSSTFVMRRDDHLQDTAGA